MKEPYNEFDKVEQDYKNIEEFIKKNFPNQRISKGSIRLKFRLPNNRAVLVFNLLEQNGFEVDTRTILFKT